ncbi:uncharacterized protein LOC122503358 [Leptopilina heterotoma]|uniref:uncharacterized protein LOC122503358 n=1 Tax=Leptopilina heterotoma TaxID=63436 RepID=UPI001CA8DE0E|nr:uncharacterized protein LOC122503358 [Leptopilina heterotoma]
MALESVIQISINVFAGKECESAFACRLYTNVVLNLVHIDVSAFLDDASRLFQDRIRDAINKYGPILVYGVLIANFKRVDNEEEVVKPIPFGTKANSIFPTTLLDDWFNENIKQPILRSVEEFHAKGSNWNLQSIIRLEVNVNKYNPMRASSYIDLPSQIKRKKACINVQNKDNECFKWAVLSALHPNVVRSDRVSNYKEFENELNFDGIDFPVTLKNVPKFEKLNDISINVYGLSKYYGDFLTHPLHLTAEKRDTRVNLLYVADMYADESVKENNKEKVPYVIYADYENLLLPADEDVDNLSKTEVFQRHKLLSIGYYIKCSYDESLCKYVPYPKNESDPAKWFAEELKQIAEKMNKVFKNPLPMTALTSQEINDFKRATVCHICHQKIPASEKKVRDHCHLTGKYRGAAHESCNLNYQDCQTIPVVFHNLSGYDAHFIIHAISTSFEGKIDLLPINKEKYISFTKHVNGSEVKFRFIDSLRFMAASLEKLASYLDEYKIVNSVFASTVTDPDKIKLLTRKGVFPYEYFD